MIKFDLDGIVNSFKALFLLIFEPRNCFTKSEDGYLTCNGVGAFQFWLIFTLIALIISMFISKTPDNYSLWFIGTSFGYSAIRMVFVLFLWALVAEAFLEDWKYAISIGLFSTGFISIVIIIPVFFMSYDIGFDTLMNKNYTASDIEKLKMFGLFIPAIAATVVIYMVIYISSVYKMSYRKSFLFYAIQSFLYYVIVTPLITKPLITKLTDLLANKPWLTSG